MYMPRRKVIKEVPMEVLQARSNMVATAAGIFSILGLGVLATYQTVANRMRDDVAPKQGPRVVIVGGNTAGSAAAAAITQFHPDARVTVLDGRREQPFNGQMGHASVGHRSYDLRTTGPNMLYTSTTWTVTRDAELVLHNASSIDVKAKRVTDAVGGSHDYDYLVLACGSQTDYGGVKGIEEAAVDTHRIATHPHGVRDGLCSSHQGNVLTVRAGHKTEFCRSADGNFLSTVTLVYEFLRYFKRVGKGMVEYHVFTPDSTPSDALPPEHNNAMYRYWHTWKCSTFHPGTRLVSIDRSSHIAHFEDCATKEKSEYPFRLLILDLPMKSPPIIEQAGLSAPGLSGYAEVDQQTLHHPVHKEIFAIGDCAAMRSCPRSYGAVFAQVPVLVHNMTQMMGGRAPNAKYDGYSSFHVAMMPWRAMWPETVALQRQRTPEEAAPVDVRPAWPTRIYDAAEDVSERAMHLWKLATGTLYVAELANVANIQKAAAGGGGGGGGAVTAAGTAVGGAGGSSPAVLPHRDRPWSTLFTADQPSRRPGPAAGPECPVPTDQRLSVPSLGKGHFWEDWYWEGWRGFAQGWYVQLFGFEVMYWFVFLRARWYPPTWFNWPEFPEGPLLTEKESEEDASTTTRFS